MQGRRNSYLYSLVEDALSGDSNSYALIYLITYEDVYKRAFEILKNNYDVQDVMFSTYISVFKRLKELNYPENLAKWVNSLFEGHLAYFLKRRGQDISEYYALIASEKKNKKFAMLSIDNAEQLLESVFMYLNMENHSVPLEGLKDYHQYKNSTSHLQRFFIFLAIILLVLIPFYTMEPIMEVSPIYSQTTATQAHYLISVKSLVPIDSVVVTMEDGEEVTAMIEGDKIYNARAIKNGKMTVTTTTINHKQITQTVDVTAIDTTPPTVTQYYLENGNLVVFIEDDNSGVNYSGTSLTVYSTQSVYGPTYFDSETGKVSLPYFNEGANLTVVDNAGNSTNYTVAN